MPVYNSRKEKCKCFSDAAMEKLKAYTWAGNVRELENVVERLSVFCMDELVELEDLPDKLLRESYSKIR